MAKAELSFETRQILERGGLMKPPSVSRPGPNVTDLLTKAIKKGFEITVTATAEEETGDPVIEATVTDTHDLWSAAGEHPGIVLAEALALALKATQPQQTRMVEAA